MDSIGRKECAQLQRNTNKCQSRALGTGLQSHGSAWAPAMTNVYGAGILAFHVWCDIEKIPEEQHAPAPGILLLAWISAMEGLYKGGMISN